jgi:hypothetical protein
MTENLPAPKPQIAAGGPLAALVPQTLDEAFRLAQALSRAGDMVPKHFQGNPDQIMAAVMRGAEIGLMPMQALSNIAVINGRASLWGDALPALVQRAGHQLDSALEGEGDSRVAVATLLRGDTGQRIERRFSVADAKKAGLWSKQGPWQSYPDRMLQMRARSLAVRDGAADALMGLQVAEETQDMPVMRDVTPPPATSANPLAAAITGKAAEPEPEPPANPYADIDLTGAFPGSAAWIRGETDAQDGKPETDCPYELGDDIKDYVAGHRGAVKAMSDDGA